MPMAWYRSKLFLPGFSLFLGGCMLVSYWLGGNPGDGAIGFGIMAGAAVLLLLGGRSETIRMARGDQRDERWTLIDLRATALAGNAVIAAVIGAWMYELAHGRDGSPYGQLGALAGIVYVIGVAVQRWRS